MEPLQGKPYLKRRHSPEEHHSLNAKRQQLQDIEIREFKCNNSKKTRKRPHVNGVALSAAAKSSDLNLGCLPPKISKSKNCLHIAQHTRQNIADQMEPNTWVRTWGYVHIAPT